MIIINLKKYYPELYSSDHEIAVSDKIAAALNKFKRDETAHRVNTYRHKAYYSLDCDDQIEREALYSVLSASEVLDRRIVKEQLYSALASLSGKQAKRIYAYYFMDLSISQIAQAEGISEQAVRQSLRRAVRNMKICLKDFY